MRTRMRLQMRRSSQFAFPAKRRGYLGMVLDDEQCMRFFDTMDALLYYVNERFRVVEDFTLNINGAIDDMKAAIVARALWDNVEVIDVFIEDNPARLPDADLRLAASWKDALPGMYTVVRYQNGQAIMMSDVGLFAVSGVSEELEHEIGPAPAYAELVLLPFEDVIVYDGFLQAYSPSGKRDELQAIQDEFENRCSEGIVSDAEGFKKVARAHLNAKRETELDALLADVAREAEHQEEVLPEGFHRGKLAGVYGEERAMKLVEAISPAEPETAEKAIEAVLSEIAEISGEESAVVRQALNCAIACAIYRGVVSFDEAYEQYRSVVFNPCGYERFTKIVREEASQPDSYFGLWTHQSQEYLTYFTLTPDYVAQQLARTGQLREIPGEIQYYEEFKVGLLEVRSEVDPRPLSRTLTENNAVGEVLGNPSVVRLRDFLDERIPDGEDDLVFATRTAEDVVWLSIETGSLEAVFEYLQETGLSECCEDEHRIVTYVTNVFNAMPSWENNGWSPQELYEKLTGRRMFYNSDGSVMKVGADDLCPCGSGLKYRDCCGR